MNLVSDGIDRLGLEAINFMVHLPQYVQLDEDFNGTARMIEALSSVYANIPADLAPTRRGQRQYRELNAAVERNSDLQSLIRQMEDYTTITRRKRQPAKAATPAKGWATPTPCPCPRKLSSSSTSWARNSGRGTTDQLPLLAAVPRSATRKPGHQTRLFSGPLPGPPAARGKWVWWRRMDSNQRPSAYEAPALPLSYVAYRRSPDQPPGWLRAFLYYALLPPLVNRSAGRHWPAGIGANPA